MPIVIAVSYGLVLGRIRPGTPTFLVLAVILLPVTVAFARVFAAVFELPFQRHRGWPRLRQAMAARLRSLAGLRSPSRLQHPAPARPAAPQPRPRPAKSS